MDGDKWAVDASSPVADLDSSKLYDFKKSGINVPGDPGITLGARASESLWASIATYIPRFVEGLDEYKSAPENTRQYSDFRSNFWGVLASAYYGTPEARRWFRAVVSTPRDLQRPSTEPSRGPTLEVGVIALILECLRLWRVQWRRRAA